MLRKKRSRGRDSSRPKKAGYTSLVIAGCFYFAYFANWGKAVLAAGLSYAEIRRKRVGVLFPFVKGVEGEA